MNILPSVGTVVLARLRCLASASSASILIATAALAVLGAPPAAAQSASDIVGGWQSDSVGDIFTFTADGKFYHAEAGASPDMEYGSYTWVPSTGAFTVSVAVDTSRNDVGFGDPNNCIARIAVSGNTMTMYCNSSSVPVVGTLARVTSTTNPIVGSWVTGTATSNRAFTFLANGTWYAAGNEDPALNPSGQKGVEYGTYTWNASTGVFTHATSLNLDGQWGLSNLTCRSAVVSGDTLTLTCADNATPAVTKTITGSRVAAAATTTPPGSGQTIAPPPASQSAYTITNGRMPETGVTVTATGTLSQATVTVTLNLAQVFSAGLLAGQGQFAAGYNIYVVALVPAGRLGLAASTFFVLPSTGAWTLLGSPIAAYLQGVAQTATSQVVIPLLQSMDVTQLVGTEFYVGWGTDEGDMLRNSRYRGVYKVQ